MTHAFVIVGTKMSGRGAARSEVRSYWSGHRFGARQFARLFETKQEADTELKHIESELLVGEDPERPLYVFWTEVYKVAIAPLTEQEKINERYQTV